MRHLSTLCILLGCSVLSAQNYNLNNYKYRHQKWQMMGFNFNFQGGYNQANFKNQNTVLNSQMQDSVVTEERDYNLYTISLVAPIFFSRFINTEKLQQSQNFSYNATINKRKDFGNTNLSTRQDLVYNLSNRFYKGKNFTEINLGTNNNFNTILTRYKSDLTQPRTKYTHSSSNLQYDVSLGIGRGRLEYVSDAVSAMFLLKDLQAKAGTGAYTNQQIEAVAKGITQINNTRFMDFRFRLIDQLTMLDSVLKANNIVSGNSIRYFTTINDNWLYAKRFSRNSGSRWSVNVTNQGNMSNQKDIQLYIDTSYEQKFYSRSSTNFLTFNYINSRQMGLYFQRSFGFGASTGIDIRTSKWSNSILGNKSKEDHMNYGIYGNWGYLYQPNTRTYINFNITGNVNMQKDLNGFRTGNDIDQHTNTIYSNISTELDFFRFISPRLYYNSSFTFTYSESMNQLSNIFIINNKDRNTFLPFSFNMGLTYLLF